MTANPKKGIIMALSIWVKIPKKSKGGLGDFGKWGTDYMVTENYTKI